MNISITKLNDTDIYYQRGDAGAFQYINNLGQRFIVNCEELTVRQILEQPDKLEGAEVEFSGEGECRPGKLHSHTCYVPPPRIFFDGAGGRLTILLPKGFLHILAVIEDHPILYTRTEISNFAINVAREIAVSACVAGEISLLADHFNQRFKSVRARTLEILVEDCRKGYADLDLSSRL
tara:strand:- start:2484 stop:3020 length:537 start_codon:yes stop_codon:yes gene_type:complete